MDQTVQTPTSETAPTKMPIFPLIIFPDADIVLRSSDGMRFHLNKQVLRNASQHFRSMFVIAPPSTTDIETLDIDIKSSVLSYLLQFLYGYDLSDSVPATPNPVILRTIDDVLPLIRAAQKLELDAVEAQLTKVLVRLLKSEPNPLRAWALAKRLGLADEEKGAAVRYCKSVENFSWDWASLPELELVNARDFNALMKRRQETIRGIQSRAFAGLWGHYECQSCELEESLIIEAGLDFVDCMKMEGRRSGKDELMKVLEPFHLLSLEATSALVMQLVVERTNCDECKAYAKARAVDLQRYRSSLPEGNWGPFDRAFTESKGPRLLW